MLQDREWCKFCECFHYGRTAYVLRMLRRRGIKGI